MGMVLVTGGCGYIGSHTIVELIAAGSEVVVLDNLCNSSQEALERVAKITGKMVSFVEGDVCDPTVLDEVFKKYDIQSVIHFAGLKAVGESNQKPIEYYQTNVSGTLALCAAMKQHNVFDIVFSSSATVYGDPDSVPIKEDFPTGNTTNPYGRSKYLNELILSDVAKSDSRWNIAILRYFNPVGAHKSGLIGEDPKDIPNNLMPYIAQVAVGKLKKLSVFGNDYPTSDGTGVRDYIHVVDLAIGHVKALEKLKSNCGLVTYNLGTGSGTSVLELLNAYEKAAGKSIPYQVVGRREGDVAEIYADPSFAATELGWRAERDIQQMVEDSWHWQQNNPNGYGD
tara:strand:+ start:2127 stop:3146 length:1020 start_codon:yes stop_codon:yes gene_type:complete